MNSGTGPLVVLQQRIIRCEKCPRLVHHCRKTAAEKRRAYKEWDYWGKPVPSFGDPAARLMILGLAPGAHGSNRTGRMFTGDKSGDLLYKVLHETGFASKPQAVSRHDDLVLTSTWITAAVRCAPPGNKPTTQEKRNCRVYLVEELQLLPGLRVVVALGKIAFDVYLSILRDQGSIRSATPYQFAHNSLHRTSDEQPLLISSYHPSQQNTSTGRLTENMLLDVFLQARRLIDETKTIGSI